MNAPQGMTPLELVQGQFDAYEVQDLDSFCAFFADDVVVAEYGGAVTGQGRAALHARYAKMFADFPLNRAELVSRMVIGATVIDHERIKRAPDSESFDVAVIYTTARGKIARMEFVR